MTFAGSIWPAIRSRGLSSLSRSCPRMLTARFSSASCASSTGKAESVASKPGGCLFASCEGRSQYVSICTMLHRTIAHLVELTRCPMNLCFLPAPRVGLCFTIVDAHGETVHHPFSPLQPKGEKTYGVLRSRWQTAERSLV